MTIQLLSVAGAAMILGAYLALQRSWLGREHRLFHALNFFGAAMLTVVAVEDRRVGFIVLEAVWAMLSLPGLLRPPRATTSPGV
jgi:hypothetical protein